MKYEKLYIVRKNLETKEKLLSKYATLSVNSTRDIKESLSPTRTEFQRDRDRIIHTNSFRRLKHKSQVFVAPIGDHFTTRLTHVIEVSQIGRSIARALNLNEDLVEATALGHDLGHTPFGHIGESVLNRLLPQGFHHSKQSVRLVTNLEKNGKGLNLTNQVIDGIKNHSKPEGEFLNKNIVKNLSLEAQIVRISDAIAYLAHDILDALRSEFIKIDQFPPRIIEKLGIRHSERINTIVNDVIITSWDCSGNLTEESKPWIRMSENLSEIVTELRNYMFNNFYHIISNSEIGQTASKIVEVIFIYLLKNIKIIPSWIRDISETNENAVSDYLCGMTDNFALIFAENIYPGISNEIFKGRI
ncbi:MAG: deoxyguanosinetriphosphate triphosphohydrolase [Dehalococcoidia bacterium]